MNGSIALPILTFLVGGILGAFIARKVVWRGYERRINQLTYENDYLTDKVSRLTGKHEELIGQMETLVGIDEARASYGAEPVNFLNLSKKYRDKDFDEHFSERVGPEDDIPLRDPFELSSEDFDIICGEIATEELRFYQLDEVLTDVDDVMLDDPYEAVGDDMLDFLAQTKKDVIYIQNDALSTVYEITVEHNLSYHHDILGEEELS